MKHKIYFEIHTETEELYDPSELVFEIDEVREVIQNLICDTDFKLVPNTLKIS